MTEYASVNRYIGHVMDEITERDAEQVAERLNELGWQKVVRCRDCAFCNDEGNTHQMYLCLNDFFTPAYAFETDPDGYCWRGERRDA